MTEKKFNCCDPAIDKVTDKIRQKVVYSSYNEADKIMKKNEARFSKYFTELS